MNPNMPPEGGQQPYGQGQAQQSFQPQAVSQMRHKVSGVLIALIVSIVLLIGVSSFAVWAYMERSTYKNETDALIADAVTVAVQKAETAKDNEFVEREKNPLRTYAGPATLGSVMFSYPKTWSAYVDEAGTGNTLLDGYFHPNIVPGIDSEQALALRVSVTDRTYADELKRIDSSVRAGRVSVSPYRAPKVNDVLGSRIVGEVERGQNVVMIMLPVRDKTVKIWTEADSFKKDFDTIVLKSLQFVK